jgi:hypothetical protein
MMLDEIVLVAAADKSLHLPCYGEVAETQHPVGANSRAPRFIAEPALMPTTDMIAGVRAKAQTGKRLGEDRAAESRSEACYGRREGGFLPFRYPLPAEDDAAASRKAFCQNGDALYVWR